MAKTAKKKETEKYVLTDEHRAELPGWARKWIENSKSCAPMTDKDCEIMRGAVQGMYRAAGYKAPPLSRIIFAPSPYAAAFIAGAIGAALSNEKNVTAKPKGGTTDPYEAAMRACVESAMRGDDSITLPFVGEEAERMFAGAPRCDEAERWWFDALWAKACKAVCGVEGLRMADRASAMREGGNMWSGWVSYVTFFRYMAKLDLDYSEWDHYEKGAVHGGPRYMAEEFCVISDRPRVLHVNDQNQLHCEDGPAMAWRDGTAMYLIEAQYIPGWQVEHRERVTVKHITGEQNEEVRRILMERFGVGRFIMESGGRVIDSDVEVYKNGAAPRVLLEDMWKQRWLFGTDGSTGRAYYMSCSATADTCRKAHESRCGFDETRIIAKS